MSLTLSQINAKLQGANGTAGAIPGQAGGGGGGADETFNDGSFSAVTSLNFLPQAFGGSGAAGDAGLNGTQGIRSGNNPVTFSAGGNGGEGGAGGDGGGASATLSNITVGASGSSPTTGGIEISGTVDGGQSVLASGGGGGSGGGAGGVNATGTVAATGGNGADGGAGGVGGNATLDVTAFTSFNSGSNGTDIFALVTGGVGGNGFGAGAGGQGGQPSSGGTGGAGGDGGSAISTVSNSTFIDATQIFLHDTTNAGQGEGGGEGGTAGPGVTDLTAPLQSEVYGTNGDGGAGGSGGEATDVVSGDTLTAPFVGITLTATGGAKAAGGASPSEAAVNNIFEITAGAPSGASGAAGSEGTGSIAITNNLITVGEGLNGTIPFNNLGTLDLTLNIVEAGVIANGGTQDLVGGVGGNFTFSGNTLVGQGQSTLDLQLGGAGSVTIDTNVGTISIAGSPGNLISGFSTFELDNNNTVIAGAGSLTLQFAPDPDTLVFTPTSGDVTINQATTANMMLDFVGFGDSLTQQDLTNDTSVSGGNTFIKIGGSTIELTGFTGTIPAGDETIIAECYRIGTRLATPDGSVAVEDLVVGDLLRTVDGEPMPVVWVGSRRIDCAHHRSPDSVRPVRVAAHAFAENQPTRDLFLSPGHAIYTEGVLIPVKHLINGDSIAMVPAREVTYFHVALPVHAVLLAEGLPAESYLDVGDRCLFTGAGENVVAFPARHGTPDVATIWETQAAAELCMSGPMLARVRDRLACRASDRDRDGIRQLRA